MDIHQLTHGLSVCPQLTPDNINELHQLGYQTIICNRPDGEQDDQPSSEQLKHESEKLGMTFIYQPIINGNIKLSDGEQFAAYVKSCHTPTLAYCRTGTRSTILWALSQHKQLSPEQIREQTSAAGYKIDESYITNPPK